MMTEKDKRLIEEARALYRAIDWEAALRLYDQAKSEEARKIIDRIVVSLYHKDHD